VSTTLDPAVEDAAWATARAVTEVAEDLAGEFSLRPLLERILLRCTELLRCDAGSVCSVDEAAGTYRKEADIGIRCQSGQVFPLNEGMTGAVVARRGPLWFARYDDVPGGHVLPEDRATLRGVIGVPLEWRGSIVGVCIVFSRDEARMFGAADAELLRLFAKHAAVALTNARMHEIADGRTRAQATAAERERLLREVYDTLNQGLVGILGHLDAISGDADRAEIAALVDSARVEAQDALAETRRTMLGLTDSALGGRDLHQALADEVG
jgi:signal transduction histidine kinase